ncbi:hypothetical protein [Parabacteroides sp.]
MASQEPYTYLLILDLATFNIILSLGKRRNEFINRGEKVLIIPSPDSSKNKERHVLGNNQKTKDAIIVTRSITRLVYQIVLHFIKLGMRAKFGKQCINNRYSARKRQQVVLKYRHKSIREK